MPAFILLLFLVMTTLVSADNDSQVSLEVDYSCSTSVHQFEAPGEGLISRNATGYFDAKIKNTGNFPSNVTIEYLNVTSQNYSYTDQSDLGETIVEYNETNITHLPYENDPATDKEEDAVTYQQQFNASYPTGWYAGHLNVSTNCDLSDANNEPSDFENFSIVVHAPFKIVSTFGEGGGVNTTGNETTNNTFPENIEQPGNQTTNQTVPENFSQIGDQEANDTIPQDSNQTGGEGPSVPQDADEFGEESDQTVEGDSDQPGQTPNPQEVLRVNIQPEKRRYTTYQGEFVSAQIEVENYGNTTANNIDLVPEVDRFREGWEITAGQIANLTPGESTTREVFVRPPMNQIPDTYTIPVYARENQRDIDIDFFNLKVNETNLPSTARIVQVPRNMEIESGESAPLPVLIENTGRTELSNLTAEIQNAGNCADLESDSINNIPVNESGSLNLGLNAQEGSSECDSTLIVSSEEGAYTFANIQISVVPSDVLIPEEQRPPFIAIIWTLVLIAYAVAREKLDIESISLEIPFILLLIGETLILLYMVVNYYSIVSLSFLPF